MDISYRLTKPVNVMTALRQMGYHPVLDRRSQHESWSRTLGRGFYPRFHLYVTTANDQEIELSLHLDQKQFTMQAVKSRHGGEYHGSVVEAEGGRIRRWLDYFMSV